MMGGETSKGVEIIRRNQQEDPPTNGVLPAHPHDRPRYTKPLAHSTGKRESVIAISLIIEHLQHYFMKTGLVSRTA